MSNALGALGTIVDWRAERKKLVWYVEDFIAPGKVTAIVAEAYGGKSPLANWVALCLATGHDVFPGRWRVPKAEPVVYLDWETGALAEERFARMANVLGADLVELGSDLTLIHCDQGLSDAVYVQLEAGIKDNQAKVAFVDTYSAALPGEIDFNSSQFSVHLRNLGKVSQATGAAIVVLFHQNKRADGGLKSISGHGTAGGAIQTAIELRKVADGIEVKCARHPRKAWEPFTLAWKDSAGPAGESLKGDDGVPWGLRPELVLDGGRQDGTATRSPLTTVNAQRAAKAADDTQEAGLAMWRALRAASGTGWRARKELIAVGGGSDRAGKRALTRLVSTGIFEMNAISEYRLVRAGATEVEVMAALAGMGARAA